MFSSNLVLAVELNLYLLLRVFHELKMPEVPHILI